MAKCVQVTQNQDGTLTLKPDSQTDLSQCSYVIQTGAEAANSLTALAPDQGLLIGTVIGALWAGAWGFKQVGKIFDWNENEIE